MVSRLSFRKAWKQGLRKWTMKNAGCSNFKIQHSFLLLSNWTTARTLQRRFTGMKNCLGQLRYMFEKVADGARLSVKGTFDGEDEHLGILERICKDPDNLTIYFESGHTFARGRMFRTTFRDAQF